MTWWQHVSVEASEDEYAREGAFLSCRLWGLRSRFDEGLRQKALLSIERMVAIKGSDHGFTASVISFSVNGFMVIRSFGSSVGRLFGLAGLVRFSARHSFLVASNIASPSASASIFSRPKPPRQGFARAFEKTGADAEGKRDCPWLPARAQRRTHLSTGTGAGAARFRSDLRWLPAGARGPGELQMRRASSSVVLNFAEGYAKTTRAEQRRFFNIAQASAQESLAILDVAFDLGLIDKAFHHSRSRRWRPRYIKMLVKFRR